jgi:hypothetical protein
LVSPPSSAGASEALKGLLEELVKGLLAAVRRGEAAALAAARRLESAMLMAGEAWIRVWRRELGWIRRIQGCCWLV